MPLTWPWKSQYPSDHTSATIIASVLLSVVGNNTGVTIKRQGLLGPYWRLATSVGLAKEVIFEHHIGCGFLHFNICLNREN